MNNGCTLKFLRFLEDTMTAVDQEAERMAEMAESMDIMDQLEESLNKNSTHLRNSNPSNYQMTEDDTNALVERALADVGADAGKCDPPGIKETTTGYSLCM